MRVKLNLAVSPSRRERYAVAWTVPLALVALAGLAFLCRTTAREFTEYRNVHRERVRLEDRENALLKAEGDLVKDFERPDFRGVSHQAQFVNALIEKKRLTLTDLTAKVAKVLPPSVHLTSLSFSRQEGDRVVHLVVSSRSAGSLRAARTNPSLRRKRSTSNVSSPKISERRPLAARRFSSICHRRSWAWT